ncbi:MAG: protein kinase [Ignavibacteriales bacterium]|nr:protein kinase [Ignavibacteriales bacterium]
MIGNIILHYKILEKLGEGGMGVVYKAEDTKLKRIVALKFLPHHLSISNEDNARLLNEAQMTAKLNHPHICTVHDIEEADEERFIVMEFVDGVTLRKKIKENNLTIEESVNYAIQIGEALEEAHSQGVVHRDIKPDNIMINSKNQIKVMDFGIAKLKEGLGVTRTMSTSGTVSYMAPEQLSNSKIDGRADIFSLGVLFYEMLSGRLPFRGEHHASMIYSLMNEEPEPINKYLTEVSSEMLHVLNRALEKDPGDRYQHIDDMVSELRRVQKQSARVSRRTIGETSVHTSGEKTTETLNIERNTSETNHKIQSQKRIRLLIGLGIILVLLIAGFIGYTSFFGKHQSIDSIAVLPFENVGADPNTEYLSDGITESLINTLSQLSNLTVMSSSSVFHYKGKDIDPQKAGKELGVKAVLRGRVTQRGDNLQISTELVNVSNNSHIWGEQYNKKLSDILTVQEEISKNISQKLSLKLIDEDEKKLTKHSTENTEAYQLYLKGRFHWNKRNTDHLEKAVNYFNLAIEKDPGYALAYAGLASTYSLLPEYSGKPPKDFIPKAEKAAMKAMELDATLAEPHAALGYNMNNQWDWKGAEREYKRAIELDPNYPTAHHWYGEILEQQGKLEEALSEIKRAQELDPLSPIIATLAGGVLYYMRHYDQAIEQIKKVLELDQNFLYVHVFLGNIYVQQNKFDEAISEHQKVRQIVGSDDPFGLGNLGYAYARSGKKNEAIKVLNQLFEFSKKGYTLSNQIAMVYAGLDDKDQAFEWLEKGYNEQNRNLGFLKVHPMWDNLRSDSRYTTLLKKMGLEK